MDRRITNMVGIWNEVQVEQEGKKIAEGASAICLDVHTHKPVQEQFSAARFIKTFFGPVFYFRVLAPVKSDMEGEIHAILPTPKLWKVMGVIHQGATVEEIATFRAVLKDAALRLGASRYKDFIMESTQSISEAENMMRATRSIYRPVDVKLIDGHTAETMALIVEWSDPKLRDVTTP
jgi:hypothetical protein